MVIMNEISYFKPHLWRVRGLICSRQTDTAVDVTKLPEITPRCLSSQAQHVYTIYVHTQNISSYWTGVKNFSRSSVFSMPCADEFSGSYKAI